jgi:hypothetical protein
LAPPAGKFDAFYSWLQRGGFDVQGRMFELEYMGDEGNGIVARSGIPEGERIMEVPHRCSSRSHALHLEIILQENDDAH